MYLISLGVGLLVGAIYGLLGVRSPAPPAVALIGLLGMLIGEQIVPSVKRLMAGEAVTVSWLRSECVPKISGVEAKPTLAKAQSQQQQQQDGAA
jgi:XapX domain-containing protein